MLVSINKIKWNKNQQDLYYFVFLIYKIWLNNEQFPIHENYKKLQEYHFNSCILNLKFKILSEVSKIKWKKLNYKNSTVGSLYIKVTLFSIMLYS